MQGTAEFMHKIKSHDTLTIAVSQKCPVTLPDHILQTFLKPYKLSYYSFIYIAEAPETYKVDHNDITVDSGQIIFGLPGQVFLNPKQSSYNNFKVAFDEHTLALLPNAFPFLLNSLNTNSIIFTPEARERVKSVLYNLNKLLHGAEKTKNTEIILAHLNLLLTELNSAYFENSGHETLPNPKLSKYIAFKLAVETHLTEQQDVHAIAQQLSMSTSTLYGLVKEFSGVSPKEWMTKRLMLEAQRKLQYSNLSVKELAYELGFTDPDYFSRLFKKSTGKSITAFLANSNDLSSN